MVQVILVAFEQTGTMSKFVRAVTAAVALHIIGAAGLACPSYSNCVCEGTLAVELKCNIDGTQIKISLLPDTFLSIQCDNAPWIDYEKLPKLSANRVNSFKSVSFKDCPLPPTSFKDVLTNIGVTKTMSLIIQNSKNLSNYLDRKHFTGLQELTKLLLSVNGITQLPDNLFMDMYNLTWLNIRSNGISLSEKLFKPLERLETLEISHNHMTYLSANLFSHLSLLRKLSLWQNNVTRFSNDLFTGVDVLEELDLSSNGLNELPSFIFSPLRKLKKLTLFSNKFSSLPPNLFQQNEQLDTIIIFNNNVKIRQLPKGLFNGLSNLKEVYIQRCGLEIIPYDVFANSSQITNISLAYNEIERLPEAIFNDQINLLELDLSHNKIRVLPEKIFSSLVKLEKLILNNNALEEIHGSTFSSLLSLVYLNMEQNNLKKISSYLFSNNKQRMIINLAHNKLDFEVKELVNNTTVSKQISPFALTFNLRLLNLSCNEFSMTFDDWWLNGHDNLDISCNNITELTNANMSDPNAKTYRAIYNYIEKPLKRIWIENNPISCNCENVMFLEELHTRRTKGAEINAKARCKSLDLYSCYTNASKLSLKLVVIVTLVIMVTVFPVFMVLLLFLLKKDAVDILSYKLRHIMSHKHKLCLQSMENKPKKVIVTYSSTDEDFVIQEILLELTKYKNVDFICNAINERGDSDKGLDIIKQADFSLIIFTPNYLTTAYSNITVKDIKSEMMKSNKTIYIYCDVGIENSIHTFLKDHMEEDCLLDYQDPDLWSKIFVLLSSTSTGDAHKCLLSNILKPNCTRNIGLKKRPSASLTLYHSKV